ncbi:MAG: 50S ribosomal protein L4 [Verrucomicrobia bacterium]|nr:50S ribosomal protein L4 [Verrucomicrobiota bacterium]
MKLPVINITGQGTGEVEFADDLLIKTGKGTQAVHDAVVAFMANQRLGTAKTKQMGEVAGTGKKPWKQKGTGRARAGSFQSPLWAGGAIAFGPRPRDYSKKITKKTKSLAFRKALSERLLAGDVVVLDELTLETPKTQGLVAVLKQVAPKANALIVVEGADNNLKLASRNLPKVQVEPADAVNVYELLRFDKIVTTPGSLAKLQERMAKA